MTPYLLIARFTAAHPLLTQIVFWLVVLNAAILIVLAIAYQRMADDENEQSVPAAPGLRHDRQRVG
jgi:hypothetical protein